MSASFWGGMLLTLVIVQVLVIWSIRRHRDPSLKIEAPESIDRLMPSLSGLTLGTAVAGNHVEVHENGSASAWAPPAARCTSRPFSGRTGSWGGAWPMC
jgi:hypothetical protein